MLYFRFNKDNFIAPQKEYIITEYKNGKPYLTRKEIQTISLGEIENLFFNKLNKELSLSEIGTGNALYNCIQIPIDAFSINDEVVGNFDGALKFALSEYANLPIKELDNKSLKDLGIDIEFCKRLSNSEVNLKMEMYMKEENLEYVTEEVLWRNMTDDEKVSKFSENLIKISTKNNELIIVDPYIFSSKQNKYCDMLASILNLSEARTITIVTDKKNCIDVSVNKISNKINITMDIKYSDDFHDRFWIANRENGFYTGTSFNGIGKKISLINMLSNDDVKDIIDELLNESLIL